jgi:flagellar motility protein MotE (MotC chaperone)
MNVSKSKAFQELIQWRAKQIVLEQIENMLDDLYALGVRRHKRVRALVENKKHFIRKQQKKVEVISYYEERNNHVNAPIPTRVRKIRRMIRFTHHNFK